MAKRITSFTMPVPCGFDFLADVTALVPHLRNPNRHSAMQIVSLADRRRRPREATSLQISHGGVKYSP